MNGCIVLFPLMCALLTLNSVGTAAQEPNPAESAPFSQAEVTSIQTAPVVVDGVTLFSVRGVMAYPAERRAKEIEKRIRSVAADPAFPPQSLGLEETPIGTRIVAGNQTILVVVDADARLEGVERQVLAKVDLARIGEVIGSYRYDREPRVLAKRALYAFLATLALLLGLWVTYRAIRWFRSALKYRYEEKVREMESRAFYLVQARHLWLLPTGILSLLWAAIALTAVYTYLRFVLSLFPWTRGVDHILLELVVNPLQTMGRSLVQAIPDLVFLLVLVLVTRYLLKVIRLFFEGVEKETIALSGLYPEWGRPTYRIVRLAVIAFAVVIGYPYIPGSSSDAFKGVSLFVGLIFSLGSTSFIGNVIAGYGMTYRRTFKVGDRVKIGSHFGDVEEIRLMVTHLRTPKNEVVVLPNSSIVNGDVMNYSKIAQKEGLILHTTVGIGYETPWRKVEAMLLAAAARTPGVLQEPKPFVLQKELGDFAVSYEINAYCDQPRAMLELYTALHQNILDLFNEYGVQIMTPAYESDPHEPKLVPRNQWYDAPARPPASAEHGHPKSNLAAGVEETPPVEGAK
jgi:small-conductance mechanosensitive channel